MECDHLSTRIHRLRAALEQLQLDGILIDKAENIYYLSGFTGGEDAVLLVTMAEQVIFTDFRYTEQVKNEAPDWKLIEFKPPLTKAIKEETISLGRVGLEDTVSYRLFKEMRSLLGDSLQAVHEVIETLRITKDADELNRLRTAAAIGSSVFEEDILPRLKPGITERQAANWILAGLRERGCEKESFAPIAVAGPNAALPHGRPGARPLQDGDMLTIDMGGFYQGYAGDMTRTVAIGKADARLHDLYSKVLEAQQHGVEQVRAGLACADLDHAVRQQLAKYDLDKYFGHGTGHGLGLSVHELPHVSARSEQVLQADMVITIEPGIYIPGWGGIRIEDSVIVKDDGCEIITNTPKQLIIT